MPNDKRCPFCLEDNPAPPDNASGRIVQASPRPTYRVGGGVSTAGRAPVVIDLSDETSDDAAVTTGHNHGDLLHTSGLHGTKALKERQRKIDDESLKYSAKTEYDAGDAPMSQRAKMPAGRTTGSFLQIDFVVTIIIARYVIAPNDPDEIPKWVRQKKGR